MILDPGGHKVFNKLLTELGEATEGRMFATSSCRTRIPTSWRPPMAG